MQAEIDTASKARPVRILGVNERGLESGNLAISLRGDLPWLQDVDSVRAWTLWEVSFRDVIVLDAENRELTRYNLTDNDLAVPANFDSLKGILLDAAQ